MIQPGQKVVIVDDLVTGELHLAVTKLVKNLGGVVVGILFAMELSYLTRGDFEGYEAHSLIQYDS